MRRIEELYEKRTEHFIANSILKKLNEDNILKKLSNSAEGKDNLSILSFG